MASITNSQGSPMTQPLLQEKDLGTTSIDFNDRSSSLTPALTPATNESLRGTQPSPASSREENEPHFTPLPNGAQGSMQGALTSLLWGAFAPCVPIAIVSSVLLTAV